MNQQTLLFTASSLFMLNIITGFQLKIPFPTLHVVSTEDNGDVWLPKEYRQIIPFNQFTNVSREYYNNSQKQENETLPTFPNEAIFFQSDEFSMRFKTFVEDQVAPGLNETLFRDIFSTFFRHGCQMFAHGGVVRDIILGVTPKDVDIEYTCTLDNLTRLCASDVIKNAFGKDCIIETSGHLVLGEIEPNNEFEPFEGFPIQSVLFAPSYAKEYTTNALSYDTISKVIIDVTGKGLYDTCFQYIRLPATNDLDRYLWVTEHLYRPYNGLKKLPRYWKLRAYPKNYTAAPKDEESFDTASFIINTVKTLWKNTTLNVETTFRLFYCNTIKGKLDRNTGECIKNDTVPSSTQEKIDYFNQVLQMDMPSSWYSANIIAEGVNKYYKEADKANELLPYIVAIGVLAPLVAIFLLIGIAVLIRNRCSGDRSQKSDG